MKDLRTLLEMDNDSHYIDPGDKALMSKSERTRKNPYDYTLDYTIKNYASDYISYANADFIKNLIIYIADEGKVGNRAKKEETKVRQQGVIDICKDIKKQMKW